MKEINKEKNIFSSKADALNYFQKKIKKSKIEKIFVFNHHEWKNKNSNVLDEYKIYQCIAIC